MKSSKSWTAVSRCGACNCTLTWGWRIVGGPKRQFTSFSARWKGNARAAEGRPGSTMPLPVSTQAEDAALLRVLTRLQECLKAIPVIVLGSGVSASHGLPTTQALASHIQQFTALADWSPDEKKNWASLCSLLGAVDLETALSQVALSESQIAAVVHLTWKFISEADEAFLRRLVGDAVPMDLTDLYRALFTSTATDLHVVTPNYDRLAEYAADLGGYIHFTGLTSGHIRTRISHGHPTITVASHRLRTVNIWKVHGSIDWFSDSDGVVRGLPPSLGDVASITPAIVTPGIQKYALTHDEPYRTVIQGADRALMAAPAFFCLGYGFNDYHLQPKLVEACTLRGAPLVILAKELTKNAREFLASGKVGNYLGLEAHGNGSKAYSPEHPHGHVLPDHPIWQLRQMLAYTF